MNLTVTVAVLPGCITVGDALDEAISMSREASELYIEELQERNELITDDGSTLEYSLNFVAA